ncbi:MAG: hypothetical protein M3238_05055, partial [Actinomycetota bacterium]|nr:hypothetical protein [Actinomycetota bacterium]
IIIEKQTVPNGTPGTFTFTGALSAPLEDDGRTSAQVDPGTYRVTEVQEEGWDLTRIECVDFDATGQTSTGNLNSETAILRVDPGETVHCVFTNVEEEVRGGVIDPPGKDDPDVKKREVTRPSRRLPFTGSDLLALLLISGLLLSLGGAMSLATRREQS